MDPVFGRKCICPIGYLISGKSTNSAWFLAGTKFSGCIREDICNPRAISPVDKTIGGYGCGTEMYNNAAVECTILADSSGRICTCPDGFHIEGSTNPFAIFSIGVKFPGCVCTFPPDFYRVYNFLFSENFQNPVIPNFRIF